MSARRTLSGDVDGYHEQVITEFLPHLANEDGRVGPLKVINPQADLPSKRVGNDATQVMPESPPPTLCVYVPKRAREVTSSSPPTVGLIAATTHTGYSSREMLKTDAIELARYRATFH